MTIVEINAAIQGIGVLFNFVKAHKELAEYNELSAAVSEVNAELISSQAATIVAQRESLALQQERLMLTQRIRELEEKIGQVESWNSERERYKLETIKPGFKAYVLKPELKMDETEHHLCTHCFEHGKKEIIQFERVVGHVRAHCFGCGKVIQIA